MEVIHISKNDQHTYNAFIATNNGGFLQSFEWGQWQNHLGKKAYRYIVTENDNENKNEEILLAAQFVEHKTPLGTYLYCPYGPIVDLRFKIEDLSREFEALVQKVKVDQPTVLFIRLEPPYTLPTLPYALHPAEHIQPTQTLLLDISRSADDLLTSFHQKTRYNIKVAQKRSVQVETFIQPNDQVVDLIMQTSERQKYRNHPKSYIEHLWQYFNTNKGDLSVTGYLATIDSKPAASGLMVDFGTTRMYLFGGSDYAFRDTMSPYLLHWQAIRDAKEKGFTHYDFGASETASGGSGGFMRFKMGFNPEVINFGGTWDIPNKSLLYNSYSILRKINRRIKHF